MQTFFDLLQGSGFITVPVLLALIAVSALFFAGYVRLTAATARQKDATIGSLQATLQATEKNLEDCRKLTAGAEHGRPTSLKTPSVAADRVFDNVRQVQSHLRDVIDDELAAHHNVEIVNLGLDYEVTGNLVSYELVLSEKLTNVTFLGLLLNPDSDAFRPLIDGDSNLQSSHARNAPQNVERVARPKLADVAARHVRIELRSYDMPAMLHGFLVNDRHLYLSGLEVHGGKLQGGQFPYLYLTVDDSPIRRHLFALFRTWFDLLWERSPTIIRLPD